MWLLSVDTSSRRSSVALFCDGGLCDLVALDDERPQGVTLFEAVERLLSGAGIAPSTVDAYAVVNGPGPFTGLRIGLALVKGMAEPFGRPVAAVGTLEAVCQAAEVTGTLVPVVDARRGQWFAGLMRKTGEEIEQVEPVRLLKPEECFAWLEGLGHAPSDMSFVTPHGELVRPALAASPFSASSLEAVPPELAEPAGRCALRKLARGQVGDAMDVRAEYVRRSDAEELWKPSWKPK